jgi:hypothetical protein
MWIAAVAVPIGLLAVPLWLAHLEERVIRSHGTPVFDPDGAAEPGPHAPLERPYHEAA